MGFKSASPAKGLEVSKPPRSLCFEHCSESDLPGDSLGFKKVIIALKKFSNEQALRGGHIHSLGEGHPSRKAQNLIRQFTQHLYSIDVGNRNGALGQYRLVFYNDPAHPTIAKVVSVFLDDH